MVSEVEMRDEVQIIPISAITVENPRERSEKTFRALVDSFVVEMEQQAIKLVDFAHGERK